MMEYLAITILAGLSFTAGWIMKSMSVSNLVKKAKKDIKYIDTLTRKAYKKGYATGLGYKGGIR